MAEAKVLLWNADCSPAVDEDGNQLWVPASQVVFLKDESGDLLLDECGHPVWEFKQVETTTESTVPPKPPVINPPVFGPNKVDWKLIGAAIITIIIIGLFLS